MRTFIFTENIDKRMTKHLQGLKKNVQRIFNYAFFDVNQQKNTSITIKCKYSQYNVVVIVVVS